MPRPLFAFLLVAFVLAFLPPVAHALPCTTSWINPAGGAWGTAANWDAGLPTAADHACIMLDGTYTVTVNGFVVDELTLGRATGAGAQTLVNSGLVTLSRASRIRATGVFEWTDGYLLAGRLTNYGLVRLTGPSTARGVENAGTVFRNVGTVEHAGAGAFHLKDNARVENAELWDITGSGGLLASVGPTVFANEAGATFRKSAGGASSITTGDIVLRNVVFENAGTLDVQAGTLQINEPSTHTDATFSVAAGATLRFLHSPVTFGGTLSGSPAGTVEMDTDFETEAGGATWALGGTGMQWADHSLTDGGTLTNTGVVRLTGDPLGRGVGDLLADASENAGIVFRNEGTVVHAGEGRFTVRDGTRVENAALWRLTGAGTIWGGSHETTVFANGPGATFRKSTPDALSVFIGDVTLENAGTLDVQTGALNLSVPSTHTDATFIVAPGATLRFFANGATFVGTASGTIEGTLTVVDDVVAGAGATWDFGGTGLDWAQGDLTSGTLTNAGIVRLTDGLFDQGVKGLGTVFRNDGTVLHTGATDFNIDDGARVENAGLWEFTADGEISGHRFGDAVFFNEAGATLRKSGAGMARLFAFPDGLTVENAGAVDVRGDTLEVDVAFVHQAGARLTGTGVFIAGSDVTHLGDTAPGLAPGLPGHLTWVGDYAPDGTATYLAQIGGTTPGTEHDRVAVHGDATLGGALHVTYVVGYLPTPGATFRLLTCTGTCSGTFDTVVLPPGLDAEVVYSEQGIDLVVADPEPTYTVTAPAAGARWAYGEKYSIKWTGPSLPDASQNARIFLVDGVHAPVEIALVKNKGSFKFKDIDATLPPGTTYRVRVELDGDPAVYGLSAPFTIYDPAETFVFTSPVAGETYARGTTQTVTWTSPAAAEGPVVLSLVRVSTPVFSVTIPDTGTYDYAVPASGIVSTHYFTIRDADAPLYFGESDRVVIGRFQVTDPVQADVWTAGETRTVAWAGPNLNGAGTLKVLLKRKGYANTTLATLVPYSAGSVTVTVPGVEPAADYFVTLVYSLGANPPLTVNSLEFTVTGGSPRVAASAPSHLASPAGVEDWTELSVVAPSMEDGTEIGAFAGDRLLASGRAQGGAAVVWVPGTYVDGEGDDVSVAPSAPITLRAFTDGAEVALVPSSVTSGTTGEAAALALSAGDVLFVAVETPVPAEAALTVALPTETALRAPSPNPAAGRVALRYDLAAAAAVRVTVYDALGRLVAVVADGAHEAGRYEASVDGSRLAPGVYVVRLAAGPFTATERLTVVR